MKKALMWLWMLTKRLYQKPLFALILLALPLTTLLYRNAAAEAGGAVTIALAQEAQDPLATELIQSMPGSSQLVYWRICDSVDDGFLLLQTGKADALWVFPDGLREKIEAFQDDPEDCGNFIQVFEREDSIALALTRERLSGLIYPQVARRVYIAYMREEFPSLDALTDQQLLEYYDATVIGDNLFAFESGGTDGEAPSLLLSPLRGLLALLTQLCALAAAMYYLEDRKKGTFAWVRRPWQWVPEVACQLVCVLQVAIVSGICLALCGLSHGFFREVALTGLYALSCCSFAMALRRLLPSSGILAVLTPVLCVAMLVICPVFFDLGVIKPLQVLFPMGWYLRESFPGLALYTLGAAGVSAGLQWLADRKLWKPAR